MFKNLCLFKIVQLIPMDNLAETLESARFLPCGASQEKSVGWEPPRGGQHDEFAPSVDGHTILKLTTEVKSVPADALRREVDKKAAEIEATTGRKIGKKERRALADDARLAMLPMAFAKRSSTLIWINSKAAYIGIDAGSQSKADEAVTALIKALDGLALQLVNTKHAPAASMAHWLGAQEAPQHFSVDRECELKAADESKAVVRYTRHALDTDEIAQHIALGKRPTRLALTWKDRVSFTLTEGLTLKKLQFLDVVFEAEATAAGDGKDDSFDADVAIATGELSNLIPDLLEALGGEVAA